MIRLTAEDVVNIRQAAHDGDSIRTLMEKYGVHRSTIEKIVRGLRRPDLPGPIRPRHPGWPHRMQPSSTKLTDYQVVLIRLKAAAGATRKDLAEEFGVSLPCIADIVNGRTRKTLPGPTAQANKRKPYRAVPRLTEGQVMEIREAYAARRATQAALAAKYDVWPVTIRRIVNGETHPNVGGPITHRYKKRAT